MIEAGTLRLNLAQVKEGLSFLEALQELRNNPTQYIRRKSWHFALVVSYAGERCPLVWESLDKTMMTMDLKCIPDLLLANDWEVVK